MVKLKKNLYGLKQAPRNWFLTLHTWLTNYGFSQSTADPCIYVLKEDLRHLIISVYVDDLLLVSPVSAHLEDLKTSFKKDFPIKDLGEVSWLLGIAIDKSTTGITLHQKQYINNMIHRFGLQDSTPSPTPMTTDFTLHPREDPNHTSPTLSTDGRELYRKIIGSLHYAAWCTRPDIGTAVSILSRVQKNPTEAHLTAAKRVLRYLKNTPNTGIFFPTKSASAHLIGHADSDWATDKKTRRSTTGWCFHYNGCLISWRSKLQTTVALSTCEAEYVALCDAVKEAIYLRHLLADLGFPIPEPTPILEDNSACIATTSSHFTSYY